MRWWAIALLALGACDGVFGLTKLADRSDAATDTTPFFDAPERCPASYVSYGNTSGTSLYKFVGPQVLWAEAEADCEDDARTSITHLVVFEGPEEMIALRDAVYASVGQFSAHAGYARDFGGDWYTFYSVTGDTLPTTGDPWNMNEPTGVAEETTVRFEYNTSLIDQTDDVRNSYVCECDHRRVTKTFTTH